MTFARVCDKVQLIRRDAELLGIRFLPHGRL